MIYFLLILLLITVSYLLPLVGKLQNNIRNMNYTIDRMAKQMDLPQPPIDTDLRKLLKEGKDVHAVKVARETLGLSLVEGKQYIDALKENL